MTHNEMLARTTTILLVLSGPLQFCRGFQASCKAPSERSTHINLAPQQLGSFETLEATATDRRVVLEDLTKAERVDFEKAWEWQKYLMQQHVDRLAGEKDRTQFLASDWKVPTDEALVNGGLDTIFFLEHNPVYTLVSVLLPAIGGAENVA